MSDNENETITISLQDLKALERLAVVEASHNILVNDFQASRKHTDESLSKIFDIVNSIPGKITECKDTLEKDIDDKYMSKDAGIILEEHIKSIKIWVLSSVSGATATGLIVVWLLNLKII